MQTGFESLFHKCQHLVHSFQFIRIHTVTHLVHYFNNNTITQQNCCPKLVFLICNLYNSFRTKELTLLKFQLQFTVHYQSIPQFRLNLPLQFGDVDKQCQLQVQ